MNLNPLTNGIKLSLYKKKRCLGAFILNPSIKYSDVKWVGSRSYTQSWPISLCDQGRPMRKLTHLRPGAAMPKESRKLLLEMKQLWEAYSEKVGHA